MSSASAPLVAADGVTPLAAVMRTGPDLPLSRAYRAADVMAGELAAWQPGQSSADGAVFPDRDLALARARDLARNEPHARSAIDRRVDLLVGAGIRLVAQIDAESLGLDRGRDGGTIRNIRRQIEREWRLFALDPMRFSDAARQMSLNGRFRQLARTWAVAGEAVAVIRWRGDGRARYRTCLQAIDPDRLCNPRGLPDGPTLRGGLESDGLGAVVAGYIRNGHAGDVVFGANTISWERVPRETSWGRPVLVHGFEPEREGQSRAMTPFAALVQRLRMVGKFADTELASATANALFAATLQSGLSMADATGRLNITDAAFADKRLSHYRERPPTIGGVRIPVLPPGDQLVFNASPRQTTAFPAFQTAFLRSVAAAFGLSYEQLSMDWSQTNYSSARAALNEVWRGVRREFAAFVEQVVMPVYIAFLEEAFDRGHIAVPAGLPSFWDMPGAWAASRWIGAPRGYVDPVKEAQGSALRLDNLTSTLEAECAEQGLDLEDVLDQAEYEREELARRGLGRIGHNGGPPLDEEDDDEPDAESPGDRAGPTGPKIRQSGARA